MKRPRSWWHVDDPTVGPWANAESAYSSPYMRHTNQSRPLTTQADLIAAAAPRGDVTTRLMAQLFDDLDGCKREVCSMCDQWPEYYWENFAYDQQTEMDRFGVTFDPTIRF